ncbi:MAG TPA: fibronectin type III domain-containing protein, partial [Candidatus Thermoplasmatota archaeon]|nr:fibronectin type III domain-containing protein [Candidatus Thermoplasmatota archaeon]
MAGTVSTSRRTVSMLVAASFLTTGFAVVTAPSAAATALPITLHFRSTTGFGNVDAALVGGSFLSTEASPFTFPPAVWHSIPVIGSTVADGPFDAFWTWEPAGGYSFSDVSGQVVFSATSPANTLAGEGTWVVSIWQGDTEVYATPDATTYAASQRFTDISEFTIPVGPFSATGSTLTVKIDPWFAVDDGPNAIYYDSVDFPSRLELGGGNVADTEPPTAPTGLVVGNATAASLGLNWTAATDNVGVDHYKIYRTDADPENPYDDATFASIGTTVGTSYVDTGLVPETTYSYKVSALDAAGNEGPPS